MIDERVRAVLTRLEEEDAHERREGLPAEQRSLACGPEAGRLLFALVSSNTGCRVLEIGGSRGYSTSGWPRRRALPAGGSCRSSATPRRSRSWRRNLADAGLTDWAELVEGDAFAALERLEPAFQVVFLDAWKNDYERYFEIAMTMLGAGVVVADNVHSDPVVAAYASARQADPALVSVTLPIGNGLEVTARAVS